MPQITSSKVHPTRRLKEGAWHFARTAGMPGRLFHKFGGILHEWTVDDPTKRQKWWTEFHLAASSVSPGASGATLVVLNTSSLVWLLNATDEFLYFDSDVHDNWDAASDIVIRVVVAMAGAQAEDATIDAELIVEYYADHDDASIGFKTQTRTVAHDIVTDNTAGLVHELVFVLDYDLGGNVIEREDHLKFRFRLSSVASVEAVFFVCAHVRYKNRLDWQAEKVLGAFPTEG